MNKAILAALIAATALAPIAASAQEWRGRGGGDRGGSPRAEQPRGNGGGGERFQRSGQRPDWSRPSAPQNAPSRSFDNGGRRFDRPQFQGRPQFQRPDGQARPAFRSGGNDGDGFGRRWQGDRRPDFRRDDNRPPVNATPGVPRGDRDGDGRRDWNRDRRDGQWDRNRDNDRRNWSSERRDGDRRGDWNQRRDWDRRGDSNRRDWDRRNWNRGDWDRRDWDRRGNWNRGWRNDNRYNWRDWRSRNRYAYRLPRYYAPYGWDYGYRRFSIGVTLNSILFAQNYWIADPWEYRLPPAYGPYRWVRYYNDALLVDMDTGEVVDVIYDIFW
ncbi:RcnB family protein [Sphingomonas cannabina]|uniref:RcnB family protein n=1 Tax=Sphingomonas cannabina TaxID=2899123 RepID=UPI001F1BA68C|nr:RcnB family protein [Sphingomonas cannabina]UIJ47150.1 RcnB family protein [Sphingomonas cannabina]